MRAVAILALAAAAFAQWLEPSKAEPGGTRYRTFHSATIRGPVSYLVKLPPHYDASPQARYPVIYWLHGLNGDQRAGWPFLDRLEAPPAIVILVNGLPASMYCDSADGARPVETVIVKDLIPHVDATYRSIARRNARAVEGFSMGGFGAARLGFKYPELFGMVAIMAGALHTADTLAERRTSIFRETFGGDKAYFQSESPWTLVERNAARIRGRTHIRIVVGDKDGLLDWNRQYHEKLDRLNIAHEFDVVPGVGHSGRELYARLGAYRFYHRNLETRP